MALSFQGWSSEGGKLDGLRRHENRHRAFAAESRQQAFGVLPTGLGISDFHQRLVGVESPDERQAIVTFQNKTQITDLSARQLIVLFQQWNSPVANSSENNPPPPAKPSAEGPDQVTWTPLDPSRLNCCSDPILSRSRARVWALVLESRDITCRLEQQQGRWRILVPETEINAAGNELRRYEKENRNWPPPPATPVALRSNSLGTWCLLLLLGIFHNLTELDAAGYFFHSVDWLARGSADAAAIRAGQWWRAVTALTLHTGGIHLLGNLLIGGFFIDRLNRELGIGRGWLLVLLSGFLGNLVNALMQPDGHRAVGLSTAVFGAVAVLAVRSARHYQVSLRHRWPLPLIAALALLGLLGSGGERTDLGGHLWGFAAGLAVGWLSSKVWPGETGPAERRNLAAGLGAAALILGAWLLALTGS